MAELKKEMENRIKLKMEECRLLAMDLDQAQEKVQWLEKEKLAEESKVPIQSAENLLTFC